MVRIRLRRVGRKKTPLYRIVVADSRSPRDGRFIETIGQYDPRKAEGGLTIETERANHWLDSAGVKPRLFIASSSRQHVALGGNGVLGVIAVQVLYAVCRTHGLETCTACGEPYLAKRRPAFRRRRYCPKCVSGGAPARDATRDYAQRRAEAWRLYRMGKPIPEIASALGVEASRVRKWIRAAKAAKLKTAPRRP